MGHTIIPGQPRPLRPLRIPWSQVPAPTNDAERLEHLQDRKILEAGDIVRVLTVTDELVKGILSCLEGVYNGEDVIGVIKGFTKERVVITLLHPINSVDIYRSDKHIERIFEGAPSA